MQWTDIAARRQIRHVPRKLIDRPKMGFMFPIDEWLRGPLREWAEDLLDPQRMKEEGYLNPEPIQEKWQQHISGQISWHYRLWCILMFQAWKRYWIDGAGAADAQLVGESVLK